MGAEALKAIDQRLSLGDKLEKLTFSGSYILIVYRCGDLLVSRDMFGGVDCYSNSSKNWITTNFLAAIALNESKRFSKNELTEYVLFGLTFGNQTIIEGISLLDTTKIFNLTKRSMIKKRIEIPPVETNLTKCLNENLDVLIHEFEGYARGFDGKIVAALSGGFDTRLMLALILEVGAIPDLYVYGSESDKDVIVAKDIAQGEGFPLLHINRGRYPKVDKEDFINVVESNYYDLDLPLTLFSDRSDVDTRKMRSQSGDLVLNGAGGGVFRDQWKWDFRERSLYDIFRNSYDIGHLEKINIDTNDFFSNIEMKMRDMVSSFFQIGREVSRQQTEMIFPIYRSKFYSTGNTVNNYFGNATLPFMSQPVLLQSFSVPHELKRYGEFERLMIKKLNPKLASYMSDYGFNFTTGPALKRKFMERLYSMMPPKIKTKIKSMTSFSQKSLVSAPKTPAPYLKADYLNQVIDPSANVVGSYIENIDVIKNQNVLRRIYAFEYLAVKNDIL